MKKEEINIEKDDAKLIRLYHYIPAKYAEEFLREDKIKLCDLSHSNDVCEYSPKVQPYRNNEMERIFLFAGKEALESFKRRCPLIVLSFSTRISSSAVWGHYADKGKGICLVFDIPVTGMHEQDHVVMGKIKGNDSIQFHKVNYTDNRLIIPAEECGKAKSTILYRLLMSGAAYKSTDWSYEKECRLVYDVGNNDSNVTVKYGIFYARGMLKYLTGIVLGEKSVISDIYMVSLLNELKNTSENRGQGGLPERKIVVSRASLHNSLLKISASGFEDYDFDSIQA